MGGYFGHFLGLRGILVILEVSLVSLVVFGYFRVDWFIEMILESYLGLIGYPIKTQLTLLLGEITLCPRKTLYLPIV